MQSASQLAASPLTLTDLAEVHREAEAGQIRGKVILMP